jgi:hypothetical protein
MPADTKRRAHPAARNENRPIKIAKRRNEKGLVGAAFVADTHSANRGASRTTARSDVPAPSKQASREV